MHEVLVNRLGGQSLPTKSVVRLTDRPDMTLDVYRGRKQQYNQPTNHARVLMSVYCQTVVQFSMHQRPGSRQDFDVRHLSDSCIILMTKDLA